MTSQPAEQRITTYMLPNISRSEDNQTMKFCQLIQYNQRNIFLQNLCRKRGRVTSPRVPDLFLFF